MIVQQKIPEGHAIPIINTFFRLKHIRNPGAAFGIDIGNRYIFLAISVIAIIVIFIYYLHLSKQSRGSVVALGLIMGGALGNFLDRVVYGEVTDFFEFYFGTIHLFGNKIALHFPIFNVADIGVSVGVGLLILYMLIEEFRASPTNTNTEEDEHGKIDSTSSYLTDNGTSSNQ